MVFTPVVGFGVGGGLEFDTLDVLVTPGPGFGVEVGLSAAIVQAPF